MNRLSLSEWFSAPIILASTEAGQTSKLPLPVGQVSGSNTSGRASLEHKINPLAVFRGLFF